MTSATRKKYLKTVSKASNIRLKDLDKETLFRKVKEIEEQDKLQYRRTCGILKQPKIRSKTIDYRFPEDDNSSDSSVEYYECESYKPGALGLIRNLEPDRKSFGVDHVKALVPKETTFDWVSAVILSELGLLNKFQRKSKDNYVKLTPAIRKNRRYYA